MKKLTLTLILSLVLTVSAFAEGDTPGGAKTCGTPGNPPCLVEPVEAETGIIKTFTNFLNYILG